MPIKSTITRQSKSAPAKPLVSPSAFSRNEDREAEYEEEMAEEEYVQKIRDEYKEEMTAEILEEHGEDYVVWVTTDKPDIQGQIGNVAKSLQVLIGAINKDNQITGQTEVMTELERHQLIALLKAMIIELEAPYVDRGRTKQTESWLAKVSKKAAEKEATEVVQKAINNALGEVGKLIKRLAENSSITDLFS